MHNRYRLALAAIALTLAIPARAPAQEARAVTHPATPTPTLIDVDFNGGTISEFIDALRRAADPTPVNVVFFAGASGDHSMPAIQLRQVTIDNAVESIAWSAVPDTGGRYDTTQRQGNGGAPIYGLFYQKPQAPLVARQAAERAAQYAPTLQVFMVRNLISLPEDSPPSAPVLAVDALLTAVDAVLADTPKGAPEPTVRFHPDSATLIVNASHQQMSAVNEMIENLTADLEERRVAAHLAAHRQAEAETQLARIEVELRAMAKVLEQAEQQVRRAATRLDRARKLHEEGNVSRDELAEAEHMVSEASAHFAEAQAQFELRQIEAERARIELERAVHLAPTVPAAQPAEPVIYDAADFLPAVLPETIAVVQALKTLSQNNLPAITEAGDKRLAITATPAQHEVIRAALAAIRKAAEEPSNRR